MYWHINITATGLIRKGFIKLIKTYTCSATFYFGHKNELITWLQ